MDINQWVQEAHDTAKKSGWWDGEPRSPLEIHALLHSEISEATEEVRNQRPDIYHILAGGYVATPKHPKFTPERDKIEGEAVELVDVLLRIFDYAGYKGWDLEQILKWKHEYNKTRPMRHGGKAY